MDEMEVQQSPNPNNRVGGGQDSRSSFGSDVMPVGQLTSHHPQRRPSIHPTGASPHSVSYSHPSSSPHSSTFPPPTHSHSFSPLPGSMLAPPSTTTHRRPAPLELGRSSLDSSTPWEPPRGPRTASLGNNNLYSRVTPTPPPMGSPHFHPPQSPGHLSPHPSPGLGQPHHPPYPPPWAPRPVLAQQGGSWSEASTSGGWVEGGQHSQSAPAVPMSSGYYSPSLGTYPHHQTQQQNQQPQTHIQSGYYPSPLTSPSLLPPPSPNDWTNSPSHAPTHHLPPLSSPLSSPYLAPGIHPYGYTQQGYAVEPRFVAQPQGGGRATYQPGVSEDASDGSSDDGVEGTRMPRSRGSSGSQNGRQGRRAPTETRDINAARLGSESRDGGREVGREGKVYRPPGVTLSGQGFPAGLPRIPLEERPFKCDECIQSFNRNHDLKRHKRIHMAVKPFACDRCSKQFSRKDALRRHWLVKGCKSEEESGMSLDAPPLFTPISTPLATPGITPTPALSPDYPAPAPHSIHAIATSSQYFPPQQSPLRRLGELPTHSQAHGQGRFEGVVVTPVDEYPPALAGGSHWAERGAWRAPPPALMSPRERVGGGSSESETGSQILPPPQQPGNGWYSASVTGEALDAKPVGMERRVSVVIPSGGEGGVGGPGGGGDGVGEWEVGEEVVDRNGGEVDMVIKPHPMYPSQPHAQSQPAPAFQFQEPFHPLSKPLASPHVYPRLSFSATGSRNGSIDGAGHSVGGHGGGEYEGGSLRKSLGGFTADQGDPTTATGAGGAGAGPWQRWHRSSFPFPAAPVGNQFQEGRRSQLGLGGGGEEDEGVGELVGEGNEGEGGQ